MKDVTVFDIERFAVEDGPGIRTVVFFKGCNLRCIWCQNPESHEIKPQIMYFRKECLACGRCVEVCPNGAISENPSFGFITNHDKCTLCGKCIETCYTNSRKIVGRVMSLEEIMNEILKDSAYYQESGGGVTFSGGEPLLFPDAVSELSRICRDSNIHTALETAGCVPWCNFEAVIPHLDMMYFDLKHIDSEAHRKYTGVTQDLIKENLIKASEQMGRLVVRIPVIPGVNDDKQIIDRMFLFIRNETAAREVELLPFHRLGHSKYEGLGLDYAMAKVGNLGKSDCEVFASSGRQLGLKVRSGGGGE